jgi:hypothetical protein
MISPSPKEIFLESDPSSLPNLAPVQIPTGALMEATQQMVLREVTLPFNQTRNDAHMKALFPREGSVSLAFANVFEGFASSRRLVSPKSLAQAEWMLIAETKELMDHAKKITSADNSLPPRGVAVILLVPAFASRHRTALDILDGMAALSDGTTLDNKPITTTMRFSVFGDNMTKPVEELIGRDCLDSGNIEHTSILLRWSENDCSGNVRVRTEFSTLRTPSVGEESAVYIQSVLVSLSVKFNVTMPPEFFLPPKHASGAYYEKQIMKTSDEFAVILNNKDPFIPTKSMNAIGCNRLVSIGGVYVRMSPVACGLAGVVANTAFHALLLCADGEQQAARAFAIANREGLPPPTGINQERLCLHTLGVQAEHVFFNDTVSLYGSSGKPGEPIQSPNTCMWRRRSAVVPIEIVMQSFFVMSCSLTSLMPGKPNLTPFMEMHFRHAVDLYHDLFGDSRWNKIKSGVPQDFDIPTPVCARRVSSDDMFMLHALGIDLTSKRLCLGEVISHLMYKDSTNALVQLMVCISNKVGLSASLNDAFGSCIQAVKAEEIEHAKHKQEVQRLKRVADAALVMNCSRKAHKATSNVTTMQVRRLMKTLLLRTNGQIRVDDVHSVPRGRPFARSIAHTVISSFGLNESSHIDEMTTVIDSHVDLVLAVSKVMQLCALDTERKRSFVMVHGHDMQFPSLAEVKSNAHLESCGVGLVFEADTDAAVVVVKFRSADSCLVTPLVRDAASR